LEWCIVPGARFTAGQTIFVVESDKAAVEFDAPADGVLHEILVPAGETVPAGNGNRQMVARWRRHHGRAYRQRKATGKRANVSGCRRVAA